jgi:aryl-alcohol dehydrogenase-like predicted oxidoreductase
MRKEAIEKGVERSLKKLGTDYIDIYSLYAVLPGEYEYCQSEFVPVLEKLRDQGKIRFLGITERFNADPRHEMLGRALHDDVWDVVMVGFNMLNQSARDRVFKRALERNIGVEVMFAVRLALSKPDRLEEVIRQLVECEQLDPGDLNLDDPLGFLVHEDGAKSVVDAAYRFCRHEPGAHVVLSGTGNIDHMAQNIDSLLRPPLPEADLSKLKHIFRKVDSISGQ